MANETQQPVEKKQNYIIDIDNNDTGKVQIANGVIASIIQKYTLETEGVTRFAPLGILDGLASIFSRRGYDSNIAIESTENGAVISLALNLKFGCVIPEVAQAVKNVLTEKIEAYTGYKVSKINVLVAAIEEEAPAEKNDTTDEAPIVQTF